MANYTTLKSAIQQVIKTNGNNEITGALLQQSLIAMINSLGGYYQFAGIATPSTNPGTPDQNVFYIGGAGTYSNFSSLVIPTGYIGVLKYNGTWTLETVQAGDVNAVKFVAQTLTDNQKTQARTNIEAASNEQVSQLEAKVADLDVAFDITNSYNLFDKSQPLNNGYINTSGNIGVGSSYKYSYAIPVTPGHYYLLVGRNLPTSKNVRCLDAGNNPLKVLIASTGTQYADWSLPNEGGTNGTTNGQFLVPAGAVSFQFNAVWSDDGDVNQVMLIDLGTTYISNPDTPAYKEYGTTTKLKMDAVPDSLTEEINTINGKIGDAENDIADLKEINDEIIESVSSPNLFDKSQTQVSGYINTSGGIFPGNPPDDYMVTYLIPVLPNHYYYLSGRPSNINTKNVRCVDASNNPLKVLIASTGQEYGSWSLPNEGGTDEAKNGQFKTPATAVYFQCTYRFAGVGTAGTIMLVDLGESYIANAPEPEYEPYGGVTHKIKRSALPDDLGIKSILSLLNGKTIRIFGGSVSRLSHTFGGDDVMEALSGCIIKNDGQDGGGYVRGTEIVAGQPVFMAGGICDHVNSATATGQPKYDIYILWSSTNDVGYPVGDVHDYTFYDGYDVNKLTTQAGGLNYCIKKLQTFAPESHIIVIGSLKYFGGGSNIGSDLELLVRGQKEVARLQSVPFFSLWDNGGVNYYNKDTFFTWTEDVEGDNRNDGTHPNTWAYQNVLAPKIIKQIALLY